MHAFSTRGLRLFTFTHYTISKFLGVEKKIPEKQKVVKFSWCDRGGIVTNPGKWLVCVSVRTEERVQPLLNLSIPNLINYHSQTLRCQQLVDNTMVLSTVG